MSIDWTEASTIFNELTALAAKAEEPVNGLLSDLQKAAVRYADLRVRWASASADGRADLDRERSLAHNALIDSCNALSRSMIKQGLDVTWRKRLGNHVTQEGRKTIGDFACFVHCLVGLAAR